MDMQNVSNLEIPEGEVRTIHDKDSRLLWGRVHYDTKYAGDTFQQTYSGKNLLPYPYHESSKTSEGIEYTVNSDGTITVDGTYANAGTASTFLLLNTAGILTLPAGTYYFPNQPSQIGVVLYDGSSWRSFTAANGYKMTLSESTPVRRIYLQINQVSPTQSFDNATFYPMLTTMANPTIADYEPYTGSTPTQITPSPNPDYPQDINVVTGEQTVKVTGKNICSECKVTLNNSLIWFKLPVLSSNTITLSGTLNVALTGNTYDLTIDGDSTTLGSWSQLANTRMNKQITFTDEQLAEINASSDAWIRIFKSGAGFVVPNDYMIEYGSTATPYEPYQSTTKTIDLGSIELAKIGNYQDYIYKSGDDWYVHKEIGRKTYNGTESWTKSTSAYAYYTTLPDSPVLANAETPFSDIICNNYSLPSTPTYNSLIRYGGQGDGASGMFALSVNNLVAFRYDSITTAADFKTWLSTHNTTVYYALATPTDTKITDATLIGQLNAIHEWLVRYGYYGTVSTSSPSILPMIIDRTNL